MALHSRLEPLLRIEFVLRSILPWNADNATDPLFIASSRVDADDDAGEPPAPSTTLVLGIDYSLVAVVYSIPNHFVTQFICKGRWFKYDCVQGGVTTACSAGFDSGWHHGYQHMFVYLQKSMMLPVPQPQTTAYRSRNNLERSGREPSESAVKQGPVMPPPYRSRSHNENSGTGEPLPHGPGVLAPYRSRSHRPV